MPGKARAVASGAELRDKVAELAHALGLEAETEVAVGRRIWGARRKIDVVVRHADTRLSLGIECKYQGTKGSAEEKIAGTLDDIAAWPIRGIVVFDGAGELFAIVLGHFRLGVEHVDVTGTTLHEHRNHRLGAWRMRWLFRLEIERQRNQIRLNRFGEQVVLR